MWQFILLHGVLFCGLSTALLYHLIVSLANINEPAFSVLTSLWFFPGIGLVWGYFMWRHKQIDEKSLKRARTR